MRTPENRPCFSQHELASLICRVCPVENACRDKKAGYRVSTVLERIQQVEELERIEGGLPKWVIRLDERIITDEDFETFKKDHPALFARYMRFNGVAGDL